MIPKAIYRIIYKKYAGSFFNEEKTSRALGYHELNYWSKLFFDAVMSGDIKLCKTVIMKEFSRKGFEDNKVFFDKFCCCCLQKDNIAKKNEYQELLQIKENQGVRFNKRLDWEKLLYLTLSQKMYRLGLLVRNEFLSYLSKHGSLEDRFCICIENGEYVEAKKILDDVRKKRFPLYFYWNGIQHYYDAIPGEHCSGHGQHYDEEFQKYVANKRIVIIGPSDNGEDYTLDIQNTIIVRFAHFKDADYVYKTNMSYYNGMHSVKMENDGQIPSGIEWCVFKYNRNTEFRKKVYKEKRGRMGRWSTKMMLPGSSPNMLQVALVDLSHYTKNLYVCDSNMYINNVYKTGYASIELRDKMNNYKKQSMFAQHDIIGNFLFTKSLFKNGYFKCDKRLEEILSMSIFDYVYQMEFNNGLWEI